MCTIEAFKERKHGVCGQQDGLRMQSDYMPLTVEVLRVV
jgi:hypothetical protein